MYKSPQTFFLFYMPAESRAIIAIQIFPNLLGEAKQVWQE